MNALEPQHTPHRTTTTVRHSMHSIVGSSRFVATVIPFLTERRLSVHVLRVQETTGLVCRLPDRDSDRLLRHGAGSHLLRAGMSRSIVRITP